MTPGTVTASLSMLCCLRIIYFVNSNNIYVHISAGNSPGAHFAAEGQHWREKSFSCIRLFVISRKAYIDIYYSPESSRLSSHVYSWRCQKYVSTATQPPLWTTVMVLYVCNELYVCRASFRLSSWWEIYRSAAQCTQSKKDIFVPKRTYTVHTLQWPRIHQIRDTKHCEDGESSHNAHHSKHAG